MLGTEFRPSYMLGTSISKFYPQIYFDFFPLFFLRWDLGYVELASLELYVDPRLNWNLR